MQAYTLADLRQWERVVRDLESPPRLAVIGDPVAHSRSPQMHNPALRARGIQGDYVRLHLRPEELEEGIALMGEGGFLGFNATIPHKTAVYELVAERTETARRARAVNTVAFREAGLVGHNTDAPGLGRAVQEAFGTPLCRLRTMVIGAGGGAGRAAAVQCAMETSPRLVLVNRTVAKAEALATDLQDCFTDPSQLRAIPWTEEALEGEMGEIDLIINASSVGMRTDDAPVVPPRLLRKGLRVYDMVYSPPRTRLMDEAEAAGAEVANGEEMLLWQGVLAFEFWFGGLAPVEVMREGLDS